MKKYYFIGIGGIGMSGLAKILIEKENTVFGSDPATNKQTSELEKLGATIYHQQIAENITSDIETVVYTSAIPKDNPELLRAKALNIPLLERAELLNQIINDKHKSIAVTGTHGKTTTSSMITSILEHAKLDPTAVIGAEVHTIAGNAKSGKGEYAVAEVCEYQKAFLDIFPFAAVITNIEEDHLDCYKDLSDIISAFARFTTQIEPSGFLVVHGDDENIKKALKYTGKIIRYGQSTKNDLVLINLKTEKLKTTFSIKYREQVLDGFELQVPGIHNVLNAMAAIAASLEIGVKKSIIINTLKEFRGAERRFQILGEKEGVIFIDDYAHHPTEIQATLEGARNFYKDRRIVAVFQPHQHSRTRFLLDDFSKSFSNADLVLIPEIYAVRDTDEDKASVSSKDLVDKINQIENKANFFPDFEETKQHLLQIIKTGDVVISIGAGPVNRVLIDLLETGFSTAALDK